MTDVEMVLDSLQRLASIVGVALMTGVIFLGLYVVVWYLMAIFTKIGKKIGLLSDGDIR